MADRTHTGKSIIAEQKVGNLDFDVMYTALLEKDGRFEGQFFAAITTTGVFCRPACSARKPKPESVVFFQTAKEAMQHGYRPCKLCRPLEPAGSTPGYIKDIIKELHANPYLRIKDQDLRGRGIEPNRIRRWFKKHHHITFQGYQRMLRINLAYREITSGRTVTDAAFDSGYESLSGFGETYRSLFNAPPSRVKARQVINITRFTTPLGPMFACATVRGICLFEFTDRRMLETEFQDLQKRLNASILPGDNSHLIQLEREIGEYFTGTRKVFTVALDTPGTEFQQAVWKVLQEIPYGKTRSYKQQAEVLGNPNAVRAVASANGHNRVAIVIPCHRVIGADGSLTGYGGGLSRKKWLLDHEKAHKN